eukprot:5023311-Alexandrium_andersonii.AAC.1
MVRLWESFFNALWARNFARPGQPIIMLRPYRGVPYSAQPDPGGMRKGGRSMPACSCSRGSSASVSGPSSRTPR